MPTIEENRSLFGESYDWPQAGEEWSTPWGNAHMQWYGSILPRISAFVPTDTILEVAPGYGRWTAFLKDLCKRLIIVDLAERPSGRSSSAPRTISLPVRMVGPKAGPSSPR